MGERWFILTAVAALVVLTVLLLVVSLRRRAERQQGPGRLFLDCAERRGLSPRECRILLDIAAIAGLKQSGAIFTMEDVFDRGAAKMMEKSLAQQEDEESEQLSSELSFLREKLGFQKQNPLAVGLPVKSRNLTSKQIPIGRKVQITRRKTRDSGDIEATVIENNNAELTVKTTVLVKVTFAELWRVRYYFGASVWEFDSTVASCTGDTLVFNHSDNVRFINRRRFLRVPVNVPAFVARFPFERTLPPDSSSKGSSEPEQSLADASANSWGPPQFAPAVVTELAGPGLRIDVPLEVKVGDRVLVVLRLGEEKNRDPEPADKPTISKILQDVGDVRHTKATQNGLSIAVELTGLSDSHVNELVRATNLASLKAGAESQDVTGSVSQEEPTLEPASVQGA
jgi:hypothetical protein